MVFRLLLVAVKLVNTVKYVRPLVSRYAHKDVKVPVPIIAQEIVGRHALMDAVQHVLGSVLANVEERALILVEITIAKLLVEVLAVMAAEITV